MKQIVYESIKDQHSINNTSLKLDVAPDRLYTNIKYSYTVTALPHVSNSDHLPFMLTPVYKPRVQQDKLVLSEVRIWPPGANLALIDCFEITQLDIFERLQHMTTLLTLGITLFLPLTTLVIV